MKRLLTLSIMLFIVFGIYNADAQVKRVLLEQHTGAWCGWCPDGTVVMDELQVEYPETVIGVKWHQGDAMQLSTYNTLAQSLGVSGYPTGSIDRTAFNVQGQGVIMLSRTAWKQASEIVMEEAPQVEVLIDDWNYEESSNEISVTLTCNVLEDIDNQIAFNALLCENGVVGPNSGLWNQKNYLSGRSGYEGHPYYDEPSEIVGYEHNKVVRLNFADNMFGDEGSIPATVSAGDSYTHTFTKTLPTVNGDPIDINNIFIVGIVANKVLQGSPTVQVLNAVSNEVNNGKVSIAASVDGSTSAAVAPGGSHTFTLDVTNVYDQAREFQIEASDLNDGWSSSIDKQVVNLQPNATTTVELSVMAGANAGVKEITMTATATDDNSISNDIKVLVITNNIKYVIIDAANSEAVQEFKSRADMAVGDKFVVAPSTPIIENASDFTELEMIVWSSGNRSLISDDGIDFLEDAIDNGKKVLVEGNWTILGQNSSSFKTKLGFQSNGNFWGVSSSGYGLQGFAGDPIADGWETNATLNSAYPGAFGIRDNSIASPSIVYSNEMDTVAAVRSTVGEARAVCYGFAFENITNETDRNTLYDNTINWLMEGGEAKPAILTVDSKVTFDETEVNGSNIQKLTVENTGEATLTISNIEIEGEDSDSFFQMTGTKFLTVEPGEKNESLSFRFSPQEEGMHSAVLVFSSNNTGGTVEVELEGNAIVSSVKDGVAGKESIFTMQVGPNPIESAGVLTYNVNGTANRNVEISILNAKGDQVATLVNGVVASGTHTVNINASDFSSGNYFLVGTADGYSTQLPLVIVK